MHLAWIASALHGCTYNYPQGRVTDHRINLTLYKLDEIVEGGLQQIIDPLINEYQADQLAALGD